MSTKPTMLSISTVLTDLTKPTKLAKSAQPKNQRWSPPGRPWPQGRPRGQIFKFLALASSIPVLGLESVCSRKGCPWPWPRIFFVSLALASSLMSSTPPLLKILLCLLSLPCLLCLV